MIIIKSIRDKSNRLLTLSLSEKDQLESDRRDFKMRRKLIRDQNKGQKLFRLPGLKAIFGSKTFAGRFLVVALPYVTQVIIVRFASLAIIPCDPFTAILLTICSRTLSFSVMKGINSQNMIPISISPENFTENSKYLLITNSFSSVPEITNGQSFKGLTKLLKNYVREAQVIQPEMIVVRRFTPGSVAPEHITFNIIASNPLIDSFCDGIIINGAIYLVGAQVINLVWDIISEYRYNSLEDQLFELERRNDPKSDSNYLSAIDRERPYTKGTR